MARFRYAWRRLRRAPGYSIAVIASLTLGIGLNTAIFSLVERVVIRPLPFHDDARLFAIGRSSPSDAEGKPLWTQHFDTDVEAWRQGRTVGSLAAYVRISGIVAGLAEPEPVVGANASDDLPNVLGVQPMLGRWFGPDDVGADVVVISQTLWQRQFGRDPAILGRTLRVSGRQSTVIGVMPPGVALPLDAQYWTPYPSVMRVGGMVVARPRPGVSPKTLAAELTTLSATVANMSRSGRPGEIVAVPLREQLFGAVRPTLLLVFAATTLLLIIACANVANLSMARAIDRRRELAVRLTLGASRWSVANLLVVEAALLALMAAGIGFVVAAWSIRIIGVIGPADIARLPGFEVTPSTLLFAVGCAALAGIGTSIAPIAAAMRGGAQSISGQIAPLSSTARASRSVRRVFVSAQLALALLLLTSMGVVIDAVMRLTRIDHLGFSPENVVIASMRLAGEAYRDSLHRQRFITELRHRARSIAGVDAATLGPPPLVGGTGEGIREGFDVMYSTRLPGKPSESMLTLWLKQVDSDYFRTYGIRLRSGREFTDSDDAESPRVAILNATAARYFFGGEDPMGRVVPLPRGFACDIAAYHVVGVLDDVLQRDVSLSASPEVFIPLAQRCVETYRPTIAVRSAAPPSAVIAMLRQVLREMDPQLGAMRLQPMTEVVDASLERHRFLLLLLGIFAGLGVVLAVTGVFAVMSFFVTQRHHEIGVRLALGAQRRDIVGLVLREGALLTIAGTGVGLLVSLGATRMLAGQLYGVDANDPGVLAGGPAILCLAALAAAYLPARRAMRTDPVESLRAD